MTTLVVGLKEFRSNLTDLVKRLKDGQTRLIVLSQNKPILEVRSIELGTEFILENYV
jgi:antitoxin (DNA-binding transcriptional repressor) of toxin-antitoxin stability system